ncbi:MAG: c-type cytochrome [Bacteroidota bacterium]
MKKIIIITFVIAVSLVACNGGGSKEEKKEAGTEEKKEGADPSDNPDYQAGLAVVAKSDCLTCHKVDEKITGPSYREVANKYASYSDTIVAHLAGKIINGGYGVWGEVPMTPHPAISKEDAEAAVKYILLLKN